MRQPEMVLNREQRREPDTAIREVCAVRGWRLHALNARTNHVHVVVSGGAPPGRMLGDFKRYATRRLRELGMVAADRLIWLEDGSKRYLWDDEDLLETCNYVDNCQ